MDVLQYVLAIGNYLNAGARQGGAYGFKLATLPKVSLSILVPSFFGGVENLGSLGTKLPSLHVHH